MYRQAISRPRVLLVVSHPAVASGVETLLRLERRYEVRRSAKLRDGDQTARTWPADVALVDAALLGPASRFSATVPTLLLANSQTEGDAAAPATADPRGWVAKDASAHDLVVAVERLLTSAEPIAGTPALITIGVLLLVFLALLCTLIWIAVV